MNVSESGVLRLSCIPAALGHPFLLNPASLPGLPGPAMFVSGAGMEVWCWSGLGCYQLGRQSSVRAGAADPGLIDIWASGLLIQSPGPWALISDTM